MAMVYVSERTAAVLASQTFPPGPLNDKFVTDIVGKRDVDNSDFISPFPYA